MSVAGISLTRLPFTWRGIAVPRPRSAWTVRNVHGGDPEATDPKAYIAFNVGLAWADVLLWAPIQIAGSVGMLLGARWGFLLALMGSVPLCYTAILIYVWDRDLGFRRRGAMNWAGVRSPFSAYGILEMAYCLARLLD